MWETLKNLSGKAKAGIVAGLAVVVAAGVGLGIWQPWNQAEEPPQEPGDGQQVQTQTPQEPAEKGLSVKAGGDEVACALYEGTGWSIYVPEGWSAEKTGENNALFTAEDGARMAVRFAPGSNYEGSYVNLSAGSDGSKLLQFYRGSGEGSPSVECSAPAGQWNRYEKLFAALARTLTVGGEQPFADSYIIPQEPDWQKAEGVTVVFLDKDGFVVDESMQEAVDGYMQTWPVESRGDYTGQYRINDIQWAGNYTGITDGYIDVFRADVQYRLKDGASPEGVETVNGWAGDGKNVFLAIAHDGSSIDRTGWAASDLSGGWDSLLTELGWGANT